MLGRPVEERHGCTGASTAKSHEDDEELGAAVIKGEEQVS